jgi:3-oxoacyl-[acyl-carrier protein] reductase
MDLGLRNKAAVITGASRGIGRAIAHALAREGCHVAICARGAETLASTADELCRLSVKVFAQPCDVADAVQLDTFLESAHAALGRLDVLVNNASALAFSDDEGGWRQSVETDLMASVRATWKVVPWLEQAGGGAIVHISSGSGLEAGSPPAYAAMKAALISHSKTMAIQLAPKKIRVNCIAPGSIEFPGGLWAKIKSRNPALYAATRATIPFGRLGTAEEVADAVVFLCSERASWIAGAMLAVDGGQHKGNL